MKMLLALGALLLTLAACGDDEGADVATDSGGASTSDRDPAPPTGVPAAPGQVRSRALATVMDTGDGAELCLGPVAESYPPQCGGPAITNWDWDEQRGMFEQQGDVRWGTFAVTGTWDGTAFTVSNVIPGPLYDPGPEEPLELPEPSKDLGADELDAIATDLGSSLPGAQGAYADDAGHVLVDVLYDDDNLQEYVDAKYGAGVVVVTGALVDA